MVAETLTATRGATGFPIASFAGAGILQVAYGTYTIPAVVEDGDIFEMCWVPAGAVIVGGMFYGADIDTGTETLDMDLGWAANGGSGTYDAADPDGLGNLGVLTGDAFAAGNISPVTGLMYPLSGVLAAGTLPQFTKKTKLQIEANAASNAGHTGVITLVVYYVVDPTLAV
jgi:hypothetical protein